MMNETNQLSVPMWYKIVCGLFLAWNLVGLAMFLLTVTVLTTREALEQAGLEEAQIDFTLATPTWVNVMFGIAVVFGVLGSIALLLKSKLAIPLLIVSLLGVLAQSTYMYFLSDTLKIMGVGASPMVILGAIGIIPFALSCAKKGWLK